MLHENEEAGVTNVKVFRPMHLPKGAGVIQILYILGFTLCFSSKIFISETGELSNPLRITFGIQKQTRNTLFAGDQKYFKESFRQKALRVRHGNNPTVQALTVALDDQKNLGEVYSVWV